MRFLLLKLFVVVSFLSYAQDERISSLDFVQILDGNVEEAMFYYQNNWEQLRLMALDSGYIQSYELLETSFDDNAPFHLILLTTYANQEQFDRREDNFGALIAVKGELQLLNEKKPNEFRKVIFWKEPVNHLNQN